MIEDCRYVEHYESYVFDAHLVYCEHLNDYRIGNDCIYNLTKGEHFFVEDCVTCEDTGERIPADYAYTDDYENYYETESNLPSNVDEDNEDETEKTTEDIPEDTVDTKVIPEEIEEKKEDTGFTITWNGQDVSVVIPSTGYYSIPSSWTVS